MRIQDGLNFERLKVWPVLRGLSKQRVALSFLMFGVAILLHGRTYLLSRNKGLRRKLQILKMILTFQGRRRIVNKADPMARVQDRLRRIMVTNMTPNFHGRWQLPLLQWKGLPKQAACLLLFGCLLMGKSFAGGKTPKVYTNDDRERIVVESLQIQRYVVFGKYDSAMYTITQMLEKYEDFNFAKSLIYLKWSNLERVRRDMKAAIHKAWEAQYFAKQDTSLKLSYHISLALAGLYMEVGPADSCKMYAETALQMVGKFATTDIDINYASCYALIADAEKKAGNYARAKELLIRCVKVHEGQFYRTNLPMTLLNLAIVRLEENPNANVEWELTRALNIADSAHIYPHQATLVRFLVKYHSDRKEYAPAFQYLQRQVAMDDSTNVAAQEQTVKDLATKYETEQKEAENLLLKQINDATTRENLQLQRFNWVVGIALVVAMLLLTLIFVSRRKISRQKAELERLSLLNQQIFAVISHDFKGPMIALQSMLEMLEAGFLDEASRDEYTADMKQQIQQTTMMLENLLNWTRTELKLQVESERQTNAAMVTEEVCAQLDQAAVSKRLQVIREIPQDAVVAIPKDILTILLRNLLSNAIKFSPVGGKVKITFDRNRGVIAVMDEGAGVEKTKLDKLFKGAVASSFGTRSETGFGLGLYIATTLIEKFSGHIEVTNNANAGATFQLFLPLSKG
jgi:signal transduction histidine kinase